MADVVLPHDPNITPQETFYWCGPASSQVVLAIRGIHYSEQDLANRLGTTRNGTNHIGLIASLLNFEVPADYVVREIPGNDANVAQRELLWSDIKASVSAGYGVVANIVVPSSNYPRATRGDWPAYSGGTVYHYISIIGFNADTREVFVADSGFRPFEYWINVDQLASCIAGKGYTATPNALPLVSDTAVWSEVRAQFCGPL